MKDSFGRTIDYLRISVTDRCNLRCSYCMPSCGVQDIPHAHILSYEQILLVIKSLLGLGLKKVRLTGGEPLVRKNISDLIRAIRGLDSKLDIAMTTNAILLGDQAVELKAAGLDRVNISLDSLDVNSYTELTRGGSLAMALFGIDEAISCGLTPIKINTVVLRGINSSLADLHRFIDYAREKKADLRFLELMPIGDLFDIYKNLYVPAKEIQENLAALGYKETPYKGGVDIRFSDGLGNNLGMISPVTNSFCQECNRLRLTSDGRLKTCLHSDAEYDIRKFLVKDANLSHISALREEIVRIIGLKEEKHNISGGEFIGSRTMNQVGG